MAHPIWKDYIITAESESTEFTISYRGVTIYEGKAYAKPGTRLVSIKINDICADYLRSTFPDIFPAPGIAYEPYIFEFEVAYTDASVQIGDTVQFTPDWSYEDNTPSNLLTAPILRRIPEGAPFIITTTEDISINGIEYSSDRGKCTHIIVSTTQQDNITIEAEGEQLIYQVGGCSTRYVLYYLNAFGGWDFLAVEGKSLQTDKYTRHTIGQTYNNNQSRNRGTRNYRNDIERKWQLHTLWIDDAGAQNMHHLFGSTEVYLYDMQTEQLHPITLNNPQCEYKTYSNNGNQLVRFDIEATLAQNLTRR